MLQLRHQGTLYAKERQKTEAKVFVCASHRRAHYPIMMQEKKAGYIFNLCPIIGTFTIVSGCRSSVVVR